MNKTSPSKFIDHGKIVANEHEKFAKLAGAELKHFTCLSVISHGLDYAGWTCGAIELGRD